MTNKDGDVAMLTGGMGITRNLDDLNTVIISADFERVVPLEGTGRRVRLLHRVVNEDGVVLGSTCLNTSPVTANDSPLLDSSPPHHLFIHSTNGRDSDGGDDT